MSLRCKFGRLAVVLVVVFSIALFTESLTARAADGPTTQPVKIPLKIVQSNLVLSQRIVEPHEKTVGVTSIPGLMMTFHISHLIDSKPFGILKEPTYVGKPVYGAFRIGDGPKSVTYFAIDEAPGFAGKIYVDTNQNGDLTDDGSSEWDDTFVREGRRNWEKGVTLHASWGDALQEKESGDYTLWISKSEGLLQYGFMGVTARTGSIALGSKRYPVVLADSTADGVFTVPADGDLTRSRVILYVDVNGGVALDAPAPKVDPANQHVYEKFDVGHSLEIDGHWYAVRPNVSGSVLKAMEVVAPDASPATKPAEKKIAVGDVAPAFTIQTPDGKPLSLADFKGKVVILDFWATWCGPCQASMPGLEELYQGIKNQNVVVLSVNVCDEKKLFDKWIGIHADKDYHFTFGFDPAGKGDNSLATSTYNVMAIPTMFVISPEGKIAANIVGLDVNERELTSALKKQGIKFKAD